MPTLADYRRAVAGALQSLVQTKAAAGSTTAILECASYPIKTSRPVDSLFEDWFIFRPAATAADRARVVATYDPPSGRLYPDLAYTDAPTPGEEIELHGLIDPGTQMTDLVNAGLRECLLAVDITYTVGDDQVRTHSLGVAAPWLDADILVRRIGYLVPGEDRARVDPYSRRVHGETRMADGACWLDVGPFPVGTILYARVVKPAYHHCRPRGGAYGTQDGLSLDADEALPAADWLAVAALVEAWKRYAHLLEASANARLIRDQASAAAEFTRLSRANFQCPPRTIFRPLAWGPR